MRICGLSFAIAGLFLLTQPAVAQSIGSSTAPPDEYVLHPGDYVRIRIWPDSSLGGLFPIEETGHINLPLIGEMAVGGKPLSELRRDLRSRYAQVLRSPAVSVTPIFNVSVLGAVQRPGLYQVDPTQSLFDLISIAGGFRPDAKEGEIRIIREGEVIEINAQEALERGAGTLALALRSRDRVVVPEGRSFRATDLLYLLQSAVLIATLITRF